MATIITPFAPSNGGSGSFRIGLVNGGYVFVHNESPIILQFQAGNQGAVLVSAYTARAFAVSLSTDLITWKGLGQVQDPSSAPIVQVYGEGYAPGEWTGGEGYWPLSRGILRQVRTVALPMVSFPARGNLTMPNDPVAPGPGTIQFLSAWQLLAIGAGAFAFGHGFFHGGGASSRNVGSCLIGVYLVTFDNTATPINVYEAGRIRVWRQGIFGPAGSSCAPISTPGWASAGSGVNLAANETRLGVGVALLDGGGGMVIDFDMAMSVFADNNNLVPGPYGVYASQGGTLF